MTGEEYLKEGVDLTVFDLKKITYEDLEQLVLDSFNDGIHKGKTLPIDSVSKSLLTCKCGNKVNDLNNGLCYPCWDKEYEASK